MSKRYDYVYGSAAPKLNEQPYQPKRQVTRRKNTPVPKKQIRPEAEPFPTARIVICILIAFAAVSVIIYRYSAITEMNFSLAALNKEYESLKDSNRKLEVSINTKINQENIRKIAEERLNMKMPDSYQKIPVKVPKVNYSTFSLTEQEEKSTPVLKAVLTFFGIE